MGVRDGYSKIGVDRYYLEYGNEYKNPHFSTIKQLIQNENISGRVLDLACGNGEATICLDSSQTSVVGCDPYLDSQYIVNTLKGCYSLSFDDIVKGRAVSFVGEKEWVIDDWDFDVIICSFAMHLCDGSKLETLCYQLSLVAKELIIITPNKRPNISDSFWNLDSEKMINRVRLRRYTSKMKN